MMKTILLLLLCGASIIAQTPDDLRKKYGAPVSESYQIRPNVLLTAEYGQKDQICRMSVKSQSTDEKLPGLTGEMLKKIADELVPADRRGRNLMNGFLNLTDISGTGEDFENLKIYTLVNRQKERWMNILWKEESCNNFPEFKPFTLSFEEN